MKHTFRTRWGRWLHCALWRHVPLDGRGGEWACLDCLLKHDAACERLKHDRGLRK